MDAAQFGEYLHLIGFKPTRCDLTALKTLLTRHMAALPFQTLSTVLGEPVPIDSGSIFRKLVVQRRGGYCYELNLLLLDALTLLGFEARPLTGITRPRKRLFLISSSDSTGPASVAQSIVPSPGTLSDKFTYSYK